MLFRSIMAMSMRQFVAVRGRGVIILKRSDGTLSPEAVRSLLLGPTGGLRAPLTKIGRTLIVGFNEKLIGKFL